MNPSLVEDTYTMIKERTEYVPERYESTGPTGVETAPAIDPADVFSRGRRYPPTPLWRLYKKTKTFYTPKPILVKIYREDDLFFAENETLTVYGTGNTPKDALQDLCLHIIHFFEYYKKIDKKKLTGGALRLKKLYKDLLIEE